MRSRRNFLGGPLAGSTRRKQNEFILTLCAMDSRLQAVSLGSILRSFLHELSILLFHCVDFLRKLVVLLLEKLRMGEVLPCLRLLRQYLQCFGDGNVVGF